MGTEQRLQMLQAGQRLATLVGPAGYAGLIQAGLDATGPAPDVPAEP